MVLYGVGRLLLKVCAISNLAKPLDDLTHATTPFEWTTARKGEVQELKGALVSLSVLRA